MIRFKKFKDEGYFFVMYVYLSIFFVCYLLKDMLFSYSFFLKKV